MFRCAVCRENCWAKERVSSDSTACLIVIRAIQSPLRRFQLRGCESKWRCGHRNPSFMGSYMAVRDGEVRRSVGRGIKETSHVALRF